MPTPFLSFVPGTSPRFTHDCEECLFLGYALYEGTEVDVYSHPRAGRTEVVGRFGDEGPNYVSVPSLSFFASVA